MRRVVFIIVLYALIAYNLYACRLLSVVSRNQVVLTESIISSKLNAFKQLSTPGSENNDGWGVIAYNKFGQPVPGYIYTYTNSVADSIASNHFASNACASQDVRITRLAHYYADKNVTILIAHLRKASDQTTATLPDPHPFVFSYLGRTYSFIHNGGITATARGAMATYYSQAEFTNFFAGSNINPNNIDSGYLFKYILAKLYHNNFDIALVLSELSKNGSLLTNCTANFILSDGFHVYTFKGASDTDTGHTLYSDTRDATTNLATYYTQCSTNNDDLFEYTAISLTNRAYEYTSPRAFANRIEKINVNTISDSLREHIRLRTFSSIPYWAYISQPFIHTTNIYDNSFDNFVGSPNRVNAQNGEYLQESGANWINNNNFQLDVRQGYKAYDQANATYGYSVGYSDPISQKQTFTLDDTPRWIPYNLMNSQNIQDAFGTNFSKVSKIFAENWAYDRGNPYTKMPALQYASMYIVQLKAGETINNFQWVNDITTFSTSPTIAAAQNFSYVTQPQYEVININSLESKGSVEEIGVYAGEDCIGAAVADEYPVQVLLYTQGYEGMPLTFRTYGNGKMSDNTSLCTRILNPQTNQYEPNKLIAGNIDTKQICLVESANQPNQEETPSIINVKTYPNPFNPSTTIRFTLAEKAKVKVTVYDVKGRKVNTLADGEMMMGSHAFVWNGNDANGTKSASGIYFVKIATPQKALVNKIVMMK